MREMRKTKRVSRKIAFGGITTLLIVMSLYMTSIVPTNRITFLALSSIFISVIVVEFGVPMAFTTLIASSILGFILVPNKLIMVPYILFFGYYGIVKYFIEKINRLTIEWILKILLFNLTVLVMYLVSTKIFLIGIPSYPNIWIVIAIIQIIFIIYDYIYSLLIEYYYKRIRKIINFKS